MKLSIGKMGAALSLALFLGSFSVLPAAATSCEIAPNTNLANCSYTNLSLQGVDLRNSDLSGVDFSFADLTGANLTGANLTGAIFNFGNLTDADLSGANLTNSNMQSVELSGSNITSATLTGVFSNRITGTPSLPNEWVIRNGILIGPGANLTWANLETADLRGVRSGRITGTPYLPSGWYLRNGFLVGPGADLSNTSVTAASLRNVSLVGTTLSGVRLTGSLAGVNLTGANLNGIRSGGITIAGTWPSGWIGQCGYLIGPGANLTNAVLTNANLGSVSLLGANLTNIKSGGVSGTPQMPEGWILRNGYLIGPGANLAESEIIGNLSGVSLIGSELSGVRSRDVSGEPTLPAEWAARNGYLIGPGANLSGAVLSGSFENLDFSNTLLTSADLRNANLSHANLSNAVLRGADLGSTILTEATLSGIKSGFIKGRPVLPAPWILRNGYLIGPGANLTGANLLGYNIPDADLTGVVSGEILGNPELPSKWSLRNGYLIGPGANLENANLSSANLTGISSGDISGSPTLPTGWILRNGHLIGPGALFRDTRLSGNFDGIDFTATDLQGVRSSDVTGSPTLPTGWVLRNGHLIGPGANLENARISGNLDGANLVGANLTGVTSGEITGTPTLPTRWSIKGGYLIGPGANLENANLTAANLTGVSSGNISGSPTLPTGWVLRNGHLIGPGANLENARISGNLDGANLVGANLTGVTSGEITGTPTLPTRWSIKGGYLIGPAANLSGVDLRAVNLSGVSSGSVTGNPTLRPSWRLTGGYLVGPGADLSGANLSGLDLRNMDLYGTNLLGANLQGTNLTGSYLTDTISGSIIGSPIMPDGWRVSNGVFVSKLNFVIAPNPTIAGSAVVEKTLTAVVPKVLPKPAKISYQWYVDNVPILYSTSSTFIPDGNQVGKSISVRVTYEASNYNATHRYSTATAPVIAGVLKPAKPVVSGSAVLGQILTAKVATWAPQAEISFEWFADGVSLNATGTTLLLSSTELGKRISVKAIGTRFGYGMQEIFSEPTQPVLLPVMPRIGSPKIIVDPGKKYVVGTLLRSVTGTWDPSTTLNYEWLRNGSVISGALGSTYTLTPSDLGKKISVQITGSLSGFRDAATLSKPTVAISTGNLSMLGIPTVSGTLAIGSSLALEGIFWQQDSVAETYQWKRSGTAIRGATGSTYTLTASDKGKTISVTVTGSKIGYKPLSVTSRSTAKVP